MGIVKEKRTFLVKEQKFGFLWKIKYLILKIRKIKVGFDGNMVEYDTQRKQFVSASIAIPESILEIEV